MSMTPMGDDLRKATKWISDQRKDDPNKSTMKLVQEASVRFNLSPKDGEFLYRLVSQPQE
jgi:hypothetical protein